MSSTDAAAAASLLSHWARVTGCWRWDDRQLLTVTGFRPCRLLRSAERMDNDERYRAADEQRRNIASARRPCTDTFTARGVNCQHSTPAGRPLQVVTLWRRLAVISFHAESSLKLQPCAVSITSSCRTPAVFLGYTVVLEGRFRKNDYQFPFRIIVAIFHCSPADTFGYNVIEPFGTVLFGRPKYGWYRRITEGSEMSPMCKATVKSIV